MAKVIALLVILSYFGVSFSEDKVVDCSSTYKCVPLKPYDFVSRGFNLKCDETQNMVCNLFPFQRPDVSGVTPALCPACIEMNTLCDKFFTCGDVGSDGKASAAIKFQGGMDIDCPTDYQCNNEGKDADCTPCVKRSCGDITKKPWKCEDASHAIHNGQKIICDEDSVCNEDYIAPCNPCIPKIPSAESYIRLLRNFSQSVSRR